MEQIIYVQQIELLIGTNAQLGSIKKITCIVLLALKATLVLLELRLNVLLLQIILLEEL